MDIEKFTERARGFMQSAQGLALRSNHQQFTPDHLLKVLIDDEEGLAARLIAAMRERGDEVVRRVLAENENRWESLSDADRARMELMAKAIASRILHEPTRRIRRAAGSDEAYQYVSAMRELFGLDVETEVEAEADTTAKVTALRRPTQG